MATWSRGGRRNVKRAERDLGRVGKLEFKSVSVDEGMPILREMHMSQWSGDVSRSWVHTGPGLRIDLKLAHAVPSGVLLATLDDRPVASTLWLDSAAGARPTTPAATRP